MNDLKRLPISILVTVALTAGALAVGCSNDKSESSSSVTAEALSAGQCEAQSLDGEVASCVDTYSTCVAAANADKTACAAALASCVPDENAGEEEETDGGHHHHHHKGHHHRGGEEKCVRADSAAVKTCHDEVLTCIAGADGGTTTVDACRDTGRDCIKSAYQAAFTAACTRIDEECGTSTKEHCEQARARCADTDGGSVTCVE